MKSVCIVAAVRDEEENLGAFVASIERLSLPAGVCVSILFVEDSSVDRTREVLRDLSREHARVCYLCLDRGFGQGPAIVLGIKHCVADAYVMMDADGSHPPEVIPEMVELWLEGAEVVQCVRRSLSNRKPYRRLGTTLFQFLARHITGVDTQQQNIFYRLISRSVAVQILREPRYWRWLRFPLPSSTRLIEIDMRERLHGQSKYGLRRLVMLAIDGVLSITPVGRLAALLVLAVVGTLVALPYSFALALFIGVPAVWLTAHYRTLASEDVVSRMKVTASANLPQSEAGNSQALEHGAVA